MISYKRIDKSDSIDFNKTKESKECMICHYFCFSDGLKSTWINLMFVMDVMILVCVFKI